MDLGALTGFFHLFTYREKVYALFEKLCGARLTVSMTRIGGMAQDAPEGWFDDVLTFVAEATCILVVNNIYSAKAMAFMPICLISSICLCDL